MVCLALVCTSAAFCIPARIASNMKKRIDSILIYALASTSVLYHGTVYPLAKLVDTCVAHITAIHFISNGVARILSHKNMLDTMSMAWCCLSAWIYYNKSAVIKEADISSKWHMCVHLSAQAALLCMLYSPSNIQ